MKCLNNIINIDIGLTIIELTFNIIEILVSSNIYN
jgi:hypothetical protein